MVIDEALGVLKVVLVFYKEMILVVIERSLKDY